MYIYIYKVSCFVSISFNSKQRRFERLGFTKAMRIETKVGLKYIFFDMKYLFNYCENGSLKFRSNL